MNTVPSTPSPSQTSKEFPSVRQFIQEIPNFPIPGVLFRDITPLLSHPQAFAQAIKAMTQGIEMSSIDAIAGVESRGFILASAIALACNKGFIPIRKKGKLPPPVESYEIGRASCRERV